MGRHRTEPDDRPAPSPSIADDWIGPDRRADLRNGASPRHPWEDDFQVTYRAHQEARRAADDRRA
jgi:hypothetical protein